MGEVIDRWLPEGGTLPDDVWESRHRVVVTLGYVAAVVLTLINEVDVLQGRVQFMAITSGLWIAVPCLLAHRVLRGRTARSSLASLALLFAVALSIAQFDGASEAHFGFFVIVGLLTLYQERIPFVISIGFVVLHHGIFGTLAPQYVFDSSRTAENPWMWAAIHGAYVVAASAVFVTAWRMNEDYRRGALLADARLSSSEQRFRAVVQESRDLTLLCDGTGAITYASPASDHILGAPAGELVGQPLRSLVEPHDWPSLSARLGTGDVVEGQPLDCRMVDRAGGTRWVHVSFSELQDEGSLDRVVLHVRDITVQRRLETELRHAQKLESVGQLAAGIAHEINTPIQFIGDNVRFLLDAFTDRNRLFAALRTNVAASAVAEVELLEKEIDADYLAAEIPLAIQQTVEGVDRVATIVRAMKAFGHPGGDEKSTADLNEAVRNTLIVTGNATKDVADVVTDLGDLPPVWCHPGDVNQVLVNLVVNAAHAVGDRADATGQVGTITVRTRVDGEAAVIEVQDTGGGVPAEIADRIFEPFFTTKEVGRGTGQGLALCYNLVHDRHGGTIDFSSVPGVGTTFAVHLPLRAPR